MMGKLKAKFDANAGTRMRQAFVRWFIICSALLGNLVFFGGCSSCPSKLATGAEEQCNNGDDDRVY